MNKLHFTFTSVHILCRVGGLIIIIKFKNANEPASLLSLCLHNLQSVDRILREALLSAGLALYGY